MKHLVSALFSLVVLAAPGAAQLFGASEHATIQDSDGNGTPDAIGSFPGIVSRSSSGDERAVQVFDLTHLVGKTLIGAQIDGEVSANNSFDNGPRSFDLVLYAADDVADLADYAAPGTVIGSFTYHPPNDLSFTISVDVTAALQTLLDGEVAHAGVRLQATTSPSFANFFQPATRLGVETVEPPTVPGWIEQTGRTQISSPVLADVDGDGVEEVVLNTSGAAGVTGGLLYVWRGDGSVAAGFPVALSQGSSVTPAVGDLDGDGEREIVVGLSTLLQVYEHDGQARPGWGQLVGPRSLTLADADGDGELELYVSRGASAMVAYGNDGSFLRSFDEPGSGHPSPPGIADLDLDGDLEIVASEQDTLVAWHHDGTFVTGFPRSGCGSSDRAPAVGDLDLDGIPELVVSSTCQSGLRVYDNQGNVKAGFPATRIGDNSQPALADLDGDLDLEIIVPGDVTPGDATVFAFHHDGNAVTGFPVVLPDNGSTGTASNCVIGDVDGDEQPEILVQAGNSIHGLDASGAPIAGYPVYLPAGVVSSGDTPVPAIGDPDNDGVVEVVMVASTDLVHLHDEGGGLYTPDLVPWRMYRGVDARNRAANEPPVLGAALHSLSSASGGTIPFSIAPGTSHAGRGYLLLAGLTGTAPGTPLPGSGGTLPLNLDGLSNLVLRLSNSPFFQDFFGTLDASGEAVSTLSLSRVPPVLIGTQLVFASTLLSPFGAPSNPVRVLVVP